MHRQFRAFSPCRFLPARSAASRGDASVAGAFNSSSAPLLRSKKPAPDALGRTRSFRVADADTAGAPAQPSQLLLASLARLAVGHLARAEPGSSAGRLPHGGGKAVMAVRPVAMLNLRCTDRHDDGRGFGGKGGIRTHDTELPYTGFRVRRIRPLCHLSGHRHARPVAAEGGILAAAPATSQAASVVSTSPARRASESALS